MKGIVSVIINDPNEKTMVSAFDAGELGYMHGPLSEDEIGKSIRNRLYSTLKSDQQVAALKPSRSIVHKLADFDNTGKIAVFEPDSLERVEKVVASGNQDDFDRYRSPKALFNVNTGTCTWFSAER